MAGRLPVSIVILAWNAWEETQACLESLRPTLGLHDQVIVVDNGSTHAPTGHGLQAGREVCTARNAPRPLPCRRFPFRPSSVKR